MLIKLLETLFTIMAAIYVFDMIVAAIAARIERHNRK